MLSFDAPKTSAEPLNMANLLSRRSAPAALVSVMFAAVVLGCGGGGGGGGSSSNGSTNSGSTNSGSTNSGSTNSGNTTAGATSGTDGGSGQLPTDVVFYAVPNGGSNFAYDVRYVSPDGTGDTIYASNVANGAPVASPDPSAAKRVVFAYRASASANYGIYRKVLTDSSTPLDPTGADVVVAPAYAEVTTLQVARDGSKVVYVAGNGISDSLYSAPTSSTTVPTALDTAVDTASLSADGTKVVYSKFPDDNTATEIYVRFLSAPTADPIRLTNNDEYDDDPQFDKTGKKVVFAETVAQGRERLAIVNDLTAKPVVVSVIDPSIPAGTSPATADNILRAPSFNGALTDDGLKISFVVKSTISGASGLYTVNLDGSSPQQIVPSTLLLNATYWTTPQGRAFARQTFGLSLPHNRR